MLDRQLFQNFNWGFLIVTLAISLIGLTIIYSATTRWQESGISSVFIKQTYSLLIGFVALLVTLIPDYRRFERRAYLIYGIALALLIAVEILGVTVSGSRRWLPLGAFNLQPSEFMKLGIIIALARYFSRDQNHGPYLLRHLILPGMLIIVPFLLIAHQPDLGSAGILVLIAFSIILFMRISWKSLLIFSSAVLVCLPVGWLAMKDYQKMRVKIFMHPEMDPLGAGYHILQSKIAVGSGQLWGKGFLHGTQSQLDFIPEHHTDFIFSVLAEEWGFIGALILLGLFLLLLLWGLSIAANARTKFGMITCFGVVAMLFWPIVINISMVMGIFPVVGVPLPLISYGGSSLVTTLMGIGLLLNIHIRRFGFVTPEILSDSAFQAKD